MLCVIVHFREIGLLKHPIGKFLFWTGREWAPRNRSSAQYTHGRDQNYIDAIISIPRARKSRHFIFWAEWGATDSGDPRGQPEWEFMLLEVVSLHALWQVGLPMEDLSPGKIVRRIRAAEATFRVHAA